MKTRRINENTALGVTYNCELKKLNKFLIEYKKARKEFKGKGYHDGYFPITTNNFQKAQWVVNLIDRNLFYVRQFRRTKHHRYGRIGTYLQLTDFGKELFELMCQTNQTFIPEKRIKTCEYCNGIKLTPRAKVCRECFNKKFLNKRWEDGARRSL